MSKIYVFDKEDGKLVSEFEGNVSLSPLVFQEDCKMSAQAMMEFSVSCSMGSDAYHSMRDRLMELQNGYMVQCWALSADRKACRAITRCFKYGDRIPRKYRRKYGLVIVALREHIRCVKHELPRIGHELS